MFCHKCGSKSPEGAAYCQKCGAKLIQDGAETQATDKSVNVTTPIAVITPTSPTAKVSTAAQEYSAPKAAAPVSEGATEVCDLLKENMSSCPAIKAVTQAKNGTSIKGTIRKYLIIIAASGQAVIVSSLAFPFIILDWMAYGLIVMLASNIGWDFAEYGSIHFEDYVLMLALSLLIGGLIKTITPFLGFKEKEAISTYVSKITESKGIVLASGTAKTKVFAARLAASIIPALVGAIILIFVMMDNFGFGGGDVPAAAFNNSASSIVENVSEKSKTENSSEGSQSMQWKAAYTNKVQELAAQNDELQFALIDLTESDIPALVADYSGYYVSVFIWADETLVTVMEDWAYGAMGNHGYEYLPSGNVIRNQNSDQAGAIVYESYMTMNDAHEVVALYDETLSFWFFKDTNGNGTIDENEPFSEEPYYYYGNTEISKEEYDTYRISGEYEWITGDQSAEEIISQLNGKNGTIPLNGEDAYNIAKAWLNAHPAMATPYEPTTIKDASDVMFVHNGEEYYRFYLNGYYWLDILVNSKTGELLCTVHEESDEPAEILRLDDYYNKYFNDVHPSTGEVLYKGIPLSQFFNLTIDDAVNALGAPTHEGYYEGPVYVFNDELSFRFDNLTGEIVFIETRIPHILETNGIALGKKREEIINALGTPTHEITFYDEMENKNVYKMEYSLNEYGIVLSIQMPHPDGEVELVVIRKDYQSDEEYQESSNNIDPSSPLTTADGNTLSIGSLVYAKQNVFGVSVNYVRGYVTAIGNAGTVRVQWDTLLENRLWAFDECTIVPDRTSPSGYSYYSNASGKQVPLAGVNFNLSANELYSKIP